MNQLLNYHGEAGDIRIAVVGCFFYVVVVVVVGRLKHCCTVRHGCTSFTSPRRRCHSSESRSHARALPSTPSPLLHNPQLFSRTPRVGHSIISREAALPGDIWRENTRLGMPAVTTGRGPRRATRKAVQRAPNQRLSRRACCLQSRACHYASFSRSARASLIRGYLP